MENVEMNFNALISRHSKKTKKEDQQKPNYPGVSIEGIEFAKQRAQEIVEMLEKSEPGTILFFSGVSEEDRTRSTGNIYMETLKKNIENREYSDIIIIDEETIRDPKKGPSEIVKNLSEEIESNPDKKYVIHFPLRLKENMIGQRWMAENGKSWSPYVLKIYEMHNNDENEAFREWLKNKGRIGDLKGPNPVEEAKFQIKGISRLMHFVEKNLAETRPVIIGGVGHSWTIDAMLVYLTNNGDLSIEGFDKLGGKLIGEANFAKIETQENGRIVLKYNEKEYEINYELLEMN